MSRIEFPRWAGEFGWEIMTWAPMCRKMAAGYDEVIVSSFAGMEPLYADFATKFVPHNEKGRSLNYIKKYRCSGKYFRYGNPSAERRAASFDILIHARGIRRKASINYKHTDQLAAMLAGCKVAFIGSDQDNYIEGYDDLRGIELQSLMNYMAGAKIVAGVSSGVMHLASACGTAQVVWGDSRTYFGETLEKRYKETWNPFAARVEYIYADNWQPEPEIILEKIQKLLT